MAAQFNDVTVTRVPGTMGADASLADGTSGMMTTGVAVPGGLQLDTTYTLYSLEDLESLGVDEAYDTANGVLLHDQVSEFYRKAPIATPFWLRVASRETTLAQLADRTLTHAKQLLKDGNGAVRQLAICKNPDETYLGPTIEHGADADVWAAVPKAQALKEEEFAQFRPVAIMLEGRAFNGNAADMIDISTLQAPDVMIRWEQDPGVVARNEAAYANYAAVGVLLGISAAIRVHQHLGAAGNRVCNLQSAADGRFLSAGVSGGHLMNALSDPTLLALKAKFFNFSRRITDTARPYATHNGIFAEDTFTCVNEADKVLGAYNRWERIRTIDKAALVERSAMLPYLKGDLLASPEGTLDSLQCANMEADVVTQLNAEMYRQGEITSANCVIDPTQSAYSSSGIYADTSVQPKGVAYRINIRNRFSATAQ